MAGKTIDPSRWEELLGQLDASSGGGDVYYIKQPKTRIRLVLPSMAPGWDGDEDDEANFFAETTKHYQGQARTAFLVLGTILGTTEKNDQNVDPKKVRAIRLPKTALRSIVSALAEGHELFDEGVGHGIVLERIGGGSSERTSYTLQVSPKPVVIDTGSLEWPTRDLWEIAEAETQRSAERDNKKQNEESSANSRRKGRNVPKDVDEEEEDLPF